MCCAREGAVAARGAETDAPKSRGAYGGSVGGGGVALDTLEGLMNAFTDREPCDGGRREPAGSEPGGAER